jgi:hypothetical protein
VVVRVWERARREQPSKSRGGDSGRHRVDPSVCVERQLSRCGRGGCTAEWWGQGRKGREWLDGSASRQLPARADIPRPAALPAARCSFDVRIALAAGTMVWLAFTLCGVPIGVTLR